MREDIGDGSAAGEGDLRLSVEVDNAMLAEALSSAAARAGWRPVVGRGGADVLVTDHAPTRPQVDPLANQVVLVCEPTPYAARCALDSISQLVAAGVVCADEPGDVGCALDGLSRGQASLPLRVMELAATMPMLTERQVDVLVAVAAGRSNSEIARDLFISAASVKRELAALYCALGAPNRTVLGARARELGVTPIGGRFASVKSRDRRTADL